MKWIPTRIKIKDLKEYKNNPRLISEKTLKKLAEHIKQDGYHQRIIVNCDNTIIGGHQRKKALLMCGYTQEDEIDVLQPEKQLSETQLKRLNIRDNLEFGEYDFDILKSQFSSDDLVEIGFEINDISEIFDSLLEEFEKVNSSSKPQETTTKLGIHTLSTFDISEISKLLDSKTPLHIIVPANLFKQIEREYGRRKRI